MKKLFFYLIFVLVIGINFVSCKDKEVDIYDYVQAQKIGFTQNFVKTFGDIDPNHDWGFNNIQVFDYTKNQSSLTRSHNVNRNEWTQKYIVPANVTSNEEQAVLDKLAESTGNRDSKMTENWSNFFVYHVHKGTNVYNDHNNQSIGVASDHMNHLQAVFEDGTMDHINDFNSGQQNANWWTIEGATLMLNSTTYDFAYHNSTDNKYHNNYTIIDGNDIGYPGFYYICFDFLANGDIEYPSNKNMGVDRNYNYTDWIIRICPAEYNMEGATRIIAEDLGASVSDFDYNDVVFDVKIANEWVGDLNANKLVGYFVLRAAGGTLPLTIAGKEVHELFGVPTNVIVNTNNGIVDKSPVSFSVVLGDADWNTPGSELIKRIPVLVYVNNNVINLETETGKAPEKIAVPITFRWCNERIPIYSGAPAGYPLFKEWVKDKTVIWY